MATYVERRSVSLALRRRSPSREYRRARHRHADRLLRQGRLRGQDGLRPVAHPGADRADPAGARCRARRRLSRHAHPRGPSARSERSAREQAVAKPADRRGHRRSGPVRKDSGPRRAGLGAHSRARAAARRNGHRQAWQGIVLRHRSGSAAPRQGHPEHRARRHHDRRLRAHDDARRQRPRVRVPAPVGLHRRHRRGQPSGGAEDDHDAGRRVRRRGRLAARSSGPSHDGRRGGSVSLRARAGALRAAHHRHAARFPGAGRLRRDARQRRLAAAPDDRPEPHPAGRLAGAASCRSCTRARAIVPT